MKTNVQTLAMFHDDSMACSNIIAHMFDIVKGI